MEVTYTYMHLKKSLARITRWRMIVRAVPGIGAVANILEGFGGVLAALLQQHLLSARVLGNKQHIQCQYLQFSQLM